MWEAIKCALGIMSVFALIAGLGWLALLTITFSAWFILLWVFLFLVVFGLTMEV
jgi:uncharacterized protein (DUF58 family)